MVGRIKGIDKSRINASVAYSWKRKPSIYYDGRWCRNAECKPKNVHQFGILGSYYSKYTFLATKSPTVSLLNNGTEEGKGNELARSIRTLEREDDSLNFVGNVEARDILTGCGCGFVTDGFSEKRRIENNPKEQRFAMMGLLKEGIKGQGIKENLERSY